MGVGRGVGEGGVTARTGLVSQFLDCNVLSTARGDLRTNYTLKIFLYQFEM